MEQRIAESFGPALADTRLQAAGQDKKGNPASRKRSRERRSAADRGVNNSHDTKILQKRKRERKGDGGIFMNFLRPRFPPFPPTGVLLG